MGTNTTTNDVTALELAIAEKSAAIQALADEIDALRKQADAEALAGRVAGIAERLGTTPDAVAAFLTEVSERSGYGVDYLVSVVTGSYRVSTPASRSW